MAHARPDRLRLAAPAASFVPDVAAAMATLEDAARTLDTAAVPAFVGALECVKATAWARLAADGEPRTAPPVEDRLLGVKHVQQRTTLSAAYLYRHADVLRSLPSGSAARSCSPRPGSPNGSPNAALDFAPP